MQVLQANLLEEEEAANNQSQTIWRPSTQYQLLMAGNIVVKFLTQMEIPSTDYLAGWYGFLSD